MSDAPDGTEPETVAEPVTQTGRPPVPPRPAPSGAAAAGGGEPAQHRTERVPFPLPPLPAEEAPPAAAEPMTGQLDFGGYPPRVPGAGRVQPVRDEPDAEDGDGRDDR